MFEILLVCTGNVCRSPLAELLLRNRLADLAPVVSSAGTRGLTGSPMTLEAAALAVAGGVPPEAAASHRARLLTEAHVVSPDLILAMTRDHRRQVVELAPTRVRSVFTLREFARLAAPLADSDVARAAREGGTDAAARLRTIALLVAARRGVGEAPAEPRDDDVVDPYGRSPEMYRLSAAQLEPGIDQVVRLARIAAAST